MSDAVAASDTLQFSNDYYSLSVSDHTSSAAFLQVYRDCIRTDSLLDQNAFYAVYDSDFSQLGRLKRLNYREIEYGARLSMATAVAPYGVRD